ncbi:MAG: hypothetical protein HQL51_03555 [Magnetococcales bacterium]|nr:hypothetical protein [Magnetococcales bacterium]
MSGSWERGGGFGMRSGEGFSAPLLMAGWAVGLMSLGLALLVVYSFLMRLNHESLTPPSLPRVEVPAPRIDTAPSPPLIPQRDAEVERLLQENILLRRQLGLNGEEKKEMPGEGTESAAAKVENGLLEKENRQLSGRFQEINRKLLALRTSRAQLLSRIQGLLGENGFEVQVDEKEGRLRLPKVFEFPLGAIELEDQGNNALERLGDALLKLLPICAETDAPCPKGVSTALEGIYVEGHADGVPVRISPLQGNWAISSTRAAHVLQTLFASRPALKEMRNQRGETLFRVVGFADRQPLVEEAPDAKSRPNRRVEFRFVMAPPVEEATQER